MNRPRASKAVIKGYPAFNRNHRINGRNIYAYHSHIQFDEMGNILSPKENNEYLIFKEVCEENGIIFTDAYENFKKMYEEKNLNVDKLYKDINNLLSNNVEYKTMK